MRCCQSAGAALIPTGLRGLTYPPVNGFGPQNAAAGAGEFHLHPRYRAQRPLDALLLKTQAGLDSFVTEKYADQVSAIFAEWSASLLRSPQDVDAIAKVLSPDFRGVSLQASQPRLVRSGALEVHENKFSSEATLGATSFLQTLRSSLSDGSGIITAEFQVTSIDAGAAVLDPSRFPARLQTRVRYELVGTGHGSHREQRVGYWDLEWEAAPAGEPKIRKWLASGETQSRATETIFTDITAAAFGANSSYSAQLLHGSDYWRTVLDGACGVDIYGHNGVSVGDIDNDGFEDVYVCQPAGLPNRLYRNRGDGTFHDITDSAGVGVLENTACALFIDIDNDGRQDLIVVRTTGPLLFLNQGGAKFREKPGAFQFSNPPQGTFTGAAAADYDRDGWLDIYFCLYIYYQGTSQYKYPSPYFDAENGPPNFLMHNSRDGTFRDVTAPSGLNQNNSRYSFCCGWQDYNQDGWPDLYVVNDFGRKNLYRNNGNGTFTDVAAQAEVEDIGAGMSVGWFDYDNDGAEDLYVANMWTAAGERVASQNNFQKAAPEAVRALYRKHAMGNSLFRNKSNSFQDVTASAGAGMGRWAWSSDAWDFDHDGFPDLYITNGMVSGSSREDLNSFFWRQVVASSPNQARPSHPYEQGWSAINELIRSDGTWSGFERNVFYLNNRDGTFSDISGAVELDFPEDGRAFALADFDHDGRVEVFLKNRNAPQLRLLKNVMTDLPPSIILHLRGTKSARDAIGAVVTIETSSGRQVRTLQAGSGFLSQHSKELFFGLGDAKGPVQATIRWPSGLLQNFHDLRPNHRVWVEEGSETVRMEIFKERSQSSTDASRQTAESLPTTVETWLLAPVSAPQFSLPDLGGKVRTLSAFRGQPLLLNLWVTGSTACLENLKSLDQCCSGNRGLQLLAVNVDEAADAGRVGTFAREHGLTLPVVIGSDDVAAIYNILYRHLFDRHRDLILPTSFLIDAHGEIVKIYQGKHDPGQIEKDFQRIPRTDAERLAKALPFPGVTDFTGFSRNYLSFGSVFFQRGYYDQAATSFERALRDDPASSEALYGLGSALMQQQKDVEARDCFERAVRLNASYPDTLPNAWNNLGLLATREGRYDDAIKSFQQALALSPDHVVALENLGNAYRQQKRWDDARETLERAVDLSPEDPEANYSLAMVFAQLGDTGQAYDYLQRALLLRPAYPEALNNLGVLYLRTGRRNEAVERFEESIRVAPQFDQSYLNLARVYALEGGPDKARDVLLQLLKQHPDHAQARKMLDELSH